MGLNVLNNFPLPPKKLTSLEVRLATPPKKPSAKFLLTRKEIQAVLVATVHLNVWLLDAKGNYPEVEEMYNSLKSVACHFYSSWDSEIAYAQTNLNKLANKLPTEDVKFKIPSGAFYIDMIDEDNNIENITEPSLKLIHIAKPKDGDNVWSLQRKNFISSDTIFTAKVKWILPTINPLTFGLMVIAVLAESPRIDLKLRQKWLRQLNLIYNTVEDEIGIKQYSFKNSNILASLYTDNMYMDYNYKGTIKTYNS
jgi:hypothetical protein